MVTDENEWNICSTIHEHTSNVFDGKYPMWSCRFNLRSQTSWLVSQLSSPPHLRPLRRMTTYIYMLWLDNNFMLVFNIKANAGSGGVCVSVLLNVMGDKYKRSSLRLCFQPFSACNRRRFQLDSSWRETLHRHVRFYALSI